jgi:arginine/lysine/ornithine decarboxylase
MTADGAGPVVGHQAGVPVADAMRDYWKRHMLSFSIPAHGGGIGPLPEFASWAGEDAARFDLPMSHGVDTRDRAWEVQATAQDLFAEAAGAKQTLFSTNGSSLSARVAMMAVAGPGETLAMARNGHKSAFAGLVLSGARPLYVEPIFDDELEIAHPPDVNRLRRALAGHPDPRAVLIFTPSYYGTSPDVRALADACHERDLPLVTDDAWGLDYGLCGHPDLPEGALAQGADLAIGSVHKTLSGLSQTSVLSVGSDRIDTDRLQLCFELEESTSASSLLLSSIDGARRQFVRDGHALLQRAVDSAALGRQLLAADVPELRVVHPDELAAPAGIVAVDPTHLIVDTASVGVTGFAADDWLRDERQIDVELADHRRILALVTFAHGAAEIDRLVRALRDLVDAHADDRRPVPRIPNPSQLRTEQAMLPRDAFFTGSEMVAAEKASGRVSAELITPYPPGVPVLAPGEVVSKAILDYLREIMAAGAFVEGAADQSLDRFRVVTR